MSRLFLALGILSFISCDIQLGLPEVDIGNVTRIDVTMDGAHVRRLKRSQETEEYTPCLYSDGTASKGAWIRVRGNVTRSRPKKSYTVKIEEVGRTIRYAFDASYCDPSRIRNRLAMYAYRKAGLPAPETEGVGLFINDVYYGYYTRLVMYREDILNSHYNRLCELYKPRMKKYPQDLVLESVEKKFPSDPDISNLARIFKNAGEMSQLEWLDWLEEKADVEDLARYAVVHDFLAVEDTRTKNFYVLIHGRFLVLPWDNEHAMGRDWKGETYVSAGQRLGGDNALVRRLLVSGSPVRNRYEELFHDLFLDDDRFVVDLIRKVREWYDDMDRAVLNDPHQNWDYHAFRKERGRLIKWLEGRKGGIPVPLFSP